MHLKWEGKFEGKIAGCRRTIIPAHWRAQRAQREWEMCDLEIASALEQAPPYNLSPPFFLTGNLKHHLRRSQSHKKYRDFGPDANAMDDNLSNRTHNLRNNRVAPTRTVCAKFWSCMRDRLLGARTNNNILLENKLRLELKNGSNGQFVISSVVL